MLATGPALRGKKDDIVAQIFAGVNVTLDDVLERSVVDSAGLLVNETWLVQYFSAMEMSSADKR